MVANTMNLILLICALLASQGDARKHHNGGSAGLGKLRKFISHLRSEYERPLVSLDDEKSDRQKEIDSFIIE